MFRFLEINTVSFYRWRRVNITIAQKRIIALKERIKKIYFESKQRYGSPRIAMELPIARIPERSDIHNR